MGEAGSGGPAPYHCHERAGGGGTLPVASVRTLDAVPLKDIMAVRESLKGIVLHAPVRAGDIVADHPAGVPCRVAVTRHVPRKG